MSFKKLNLVLALGATLTVAAAFQNCGQVSFAPDDSSSEKAEVKSSEVNVPVSPNSPNSTDIPSRPRNPASEPPAEGSNLTDISVICDPFSPKNVTDAKFGIQGRIHYAQDRLSSSTCSNTSQCGSRDYISQGTKIDALLFMSQIFVPTRSFTQGFDVQGSTKVKDRNGNTLIEWFALDLKSNFSLGQADEDGLYQLGTISDDGVTLTTAAGDILKDEGEHSPKLACSTQVVALKKGDLVPFRLTYFQGPRQLISLTLMWRKITNQSLTDCGSSTDVTDQNNLPADLATRGWKVLKAQNYVLQSGVTNLCQK